MYPELLEHTLFLFLHGHLLFCTTNPLLQHSCQTESQRYIYILQFPLIAYFKICHIFRISFYDLFASLITGDFHQFPIIFLRKNTRISCFFAPNGACHSLIFALKRVIKRNDCFRREPWLIGYRKETCIRVFCAFQSDLHRGRNPSLRL